MNEPTTPDESTEAPSPVQGTNPGPQPPVPPSVHVKAPPAPDTAPPVTVDERPDAGEPMTDAELEEATRPKY